jgi:hypothetical protein
LIEKKTPKKKRRMPKPSWADVTQKNMSARVAKLGKKESKPSFDARLVWSHVAVEKIVEFVFFGCEEQLMPCALVNRMWLQAVRNRWKMPGGFGLIEKLDIYTAYFGPKWGDAKMRIKRMNLGLVRSALWKSRSPLDEDNAVAANFTWKNSSTREKSLLIDVFVNSLESKRQQRHADAEKTRSVRFVQRHASWMFEDIAVWDQKRLEQACLNVRNELFSMTVIGGRWGEVGKWKVVDAREIEWVFDVHVAFLPFEALRLLETWANQAMQRKAQRHPLPKHKRHQTTVRHWLNKRTRYVKWSLLSRASYNGDARVSAWLWNEVTDWNAIFSEASDHYHYGDPPPPNDLDPTSSFFLNECFQHAVKRNDAATLNVLIDASIARLRVAWDNENHHGMAERIFQHACYQESVDCARCLHERCCPWALIKPTYVFQAWHASRFPLLSWMCDVARVTTAEAFVDLVCLHDKRNLLGLNQNRNTHFGSDTDESALKRLQWFAQRFTNAGLQPMASDLHEFVFEKRWFATAAWLCEHFSP